MLVIKIIFHYEDLNEPKTYLYPSFQFKPSSRVTLLSRTNGARRGAEGVGFCFFPPLAAARRRRRGRESKTTRTYYVRSARGGAPLPPPAHRSGGAWRKRRPDVCGRTRVCM